MAGISAGTAWIDILPNLTKFRAAMATGLAGVAKTTKTFGKTLTHHITLPVVAAAGASVKLAVDFNESLDKIVGLVGISRKEVDRMGESILELAPKVHQGPQALADALFFITSAGFRGQKAMAVLEASAKGATSGLGEVKTVADAVTSAVNAYGAKNLSAAHAADVLSGAVKEGKTQADALAPVLGSLLPFSQRLGVSFDQVGASIASMTRIGESAPRAATALRGLYTSLLNTSPKVSDALKDVGLSQKDLIDTLANPRQGLPVVLQQLNDAFGDNILAIRGAFPNIRGLSGLLELTGKNMKTTTGIFGDMADITGQNQRAFKAITQDEGQKFHAFLVDLQTAAIRLGNVLIPVLAQIAAHLTEWLEQFQKLDPRIQKFVLIAIGIAAALGPVLLLVSALATAIGFLITPVGLVILAIAGLVAAFVVLYTHSEAVRKAVGDAWAWIQKEAARAVAWYEGTLKPTIQAVLGFLQMLWARYGGAVVSILRTWLHMVVGIFTRVFNIVKGIIEFWLAVFRGDWSAAFHALVSIVKNALGLVVTVFRGEVTLFFKVAFLLGRAIWDGIKAGLGALWSKIKSVLSDVGKSIAGFATGTALQWGKDIGIAILHGIIGGLTGLPGSLQDAIKNALPDPGGGVPFVPGIADGGPVVGGRLHMVGERGPELFVPKTNGTIIPNHMLGGMGRGGPQKFVITNWEEGIGYIGDIADGVVGSNLEHQSQIRRMRRS